MLKIKSVYSKIDKKNDGLRILVTRRAGIFLRKTRYNIWMPNLAPFTELLKKFKNNEIVWSNFTKAYKKEMLTSSTFEFDKKNNCKNKGQFYTLKLIKKLSIKTNITLLCFCNEEQKECHRHLLKELISNC